MTSRAALETYNYWGDSRVVAGLTSPAYKVVSSNNVETTVQLDDCLVEQMREDGTLPEGCDGTITGRTRNEVCGICEGSGSMVNPSIDAGGLTSDDFYDDPDFYDDYMGGTYDVTCSGCNGNKVVPRVVFPGPIAKAIADWEQEEADYAAEVAAERRMGA